MPARLTLPTLLVAAAQLMVSACGEDPTPPPPRPDPARKPTMVIVSGNGQRAEVRTALPAPLVVQVLDSLNRPARDVVVRFSNAGAPASDSMATNSQGIASVVWTLDSLAIDQEILAQATVHPGPANGIAVAMFRAGATAGPPARLTLAGGDGAVAAPGGSVDTVTVDAFDRYGNPAAGAPVEWLVKIGGGTIRPIDTRTDDRGRAHAIWHLGPTEGPNALDVIAGSITGRVTATASVEFPGKEVVVGEYHSCALTSRGVAYCWGVNSGGQLGAGRIDEASNASPQRVAGGLTFTSLVAGLEHTCGLTDRGEAYCWGNGRAGQLGSGSVGLTSAPARVASGLSYLTLAAGARHTCGLTTGRSIYCWGDNSFGQLGDAVDRPIGPSGNRAYPVLISAAGAPAFLAIAAGALSTCAISTNGGTYCWGANSVRELGGDLPGRCAVIGTAALYDGTTPVPCSAAPVRVEVETLVSLAASKSGWCGVTTGARLVCWGNYFQRPQLVPEARATTAWVIGLDVCGRDNLDPISCWGVWGGRSGSVRPFGEQVPLAKLAGGMTHSCGVSAGGREVVYCWGDNIGGQLGDGTTVFRPLPVPVLSPRVF